MAEDSFENSLHLSESVIRNLLDVDPFESIDYFQLNQNKQYAGKKFK